MVYPTMKLNERKTYFCISCAKHRGIGFHEAKRRVKFGFKGQNKPVRAIRRPKTRD